MKKNYFLFLLLFTLSFGEGFSQPNCISLGCADNYGTITANTSGPSTNAPIGCFFPFFYQQVYWQFFYATSSANFTQTYHPLSTGNPTDLNFIVFDMGLSGSTTVPCPVDPSSWTEVLCATTDRGNADVGPGLNGDNLVTTVGHYYAIALIIWENLDPSYDFTIGTPQLGGVNLTSASCIVLPVKLNSFTAKVSSCNVDLDWTATSETNFKNYEIQYSVNGSNFETIETIPAALQYSSSSNQKYSYHHTSPQQGKAYYRLKMVDIDGKFEYSKIIALKLDCNKRLITIYPNPVTDVLNVNITNGSNNKTIASLFDNNGKLVYSGNMISGTNTINMANFGKGIYLLKLRSDVETQNIKIIK